MESKDSTRLPLPCVSRDLSSFFPIAGHFPEHWVNSAIATYFQTLPFIQSFSFQNALIHWGTTKASWRDTFATWWSKHCSCVYFPETWRWNEEYTFQKHCQSSLSFTFPINVELPSLRVWSGFILGSNLPRYLVALVSLCTFSGPSSDYLRTGRGLLYRCDKSSKGCSLIDR